jgi:hypothetical protein
MEPEDVRAHAQATCDALVAGDIDRAAEELSPELKSNMGTFVGLLPLPLTSATIESVERGGSSGFNVVLHLVGETSEVRLQTRWKDRDGEPTIIEASNLTENAIAAAAAGGAETDAEAGDDDEGEGSPTTDG